MTTCLGESCSVDLLCVSLVCVIPFVFASFPFGLEGVMWGLIVFCS